MRQQDDRGLLGEPHDGRHEDEGLAGDHGQLHGRARRGLRVGRRILGRDRAFRLVQVLDVLGLDHHQSRLLRKGLSFGELLVDEVGDGHRLGGGSGPRHETEHQEGRHDQDPEAEQA